MSRRTKRLRENVLRSDPPLAQTSEVGSEHNSATNNAEGASNNINELFSAFMKNMLQNAENNAPPAKRTLKPCEVFIPIYDPDECDITAAQWCEEVDNHRKQNNWTSYETKNVALTHLRGRAQKWAKQSYALCKTWEEVQTRLSQFFATTKRFHDLFSEMVNYTSEKAASYVEYASSKLAMIERLNSSWSESNKIEVVILGIKEPQIHSELLKNTPSDFLTLERHLSTYGKVKDYGKHSEVEHNPKRRKMDELTNIKKCFKCGQQGHLKRHCKVQDNVTNSRIEVKEIKSKSSKGSDQCTYCNKSGHSIRTCFARQRDEKENQLSGNKSINLCSSYELPLIEVQIGSYTLDAIVDTGSECCLIRREIADVIEGVREVSLTSLIGIGQASSISFGKITSHIVLCEIELEITLLIVESDLIPYDIVLGRDLLSNHELELTINKTGTKIIHTKKRMLCLVKSSNTETANTINTDLTDPSHIERLNNILHRFENQFVVGNSQSCVKTGEMQITLKNPDKIVQRHPYRLAPTEKKIMQDIVDDLIEKNIIRESSSPFSSPALLVKKKEGSYRLVVDYRELNSNTVRDNYPLPLIDEQMDSLGGAKFFSSLDMASGFHQIPMSENSIEKTAFITPNGVWEYKKMPFGLCNAPSVYQRTINKALGKLKDSIAFVYMDDVLVISDNIENAFNNLELVLTALAKAGFSFNSKKCKFIKTSIEFLGYVINDGHIHPNPNKIEALSKAPVPSNIKQLRQFNGLAGYFRKFVPNFASIMSPLYNLTKDKVKWNWTSEHERARKTIINILTASPVLSIYDPLKPLELHTDASAIGYGAILFQKEENQLKVIGYYSQKTSDVESRYHSYELETLAVFKALKHFRHYLYGRNFKVITDCNSLKASRHKKDLLPRIHRWWAFMQQFDFEVEYRKGDRIPHVDFLSRNPIQSSEVAIAQVNGDWLKAEQNLDVDLRNVITSIENDTIDKDIRSSYEIKDGILYRKFEVDKESFSKAIIPKNFRWHIIQVFHEQLKHLGWEKTLAKIREHFWFPNMSSTVRTYVDRCLACKMNKLPSGKKQAVLHSIDKGAEPFHTIHIDTTGKLSGARDAKEYVIVIVDGFTKYCYLTPVTSLTAKVACSVLRSFVSLFGSPKRIIADQGTSFTGKEFQDFCKEWSIEFHEIASGMSRANGQVERFMSILTNCFSIAQNHENKSWKSKVGEIQLAINCTISKSTGKSPLQLLIGCNKSPPGITALIKEHEKFDIEGIRNLAQEKMKAQGLTSENNFQKTKAKIQPFKLNDLVLIQKNPRTIKKLDEKFSNPCKIIEICPFDRYKVKPLSGGRVQYVCHERLRKYPPCLADMSNGLDSQ